MSYTFGWWDFETINGEEQMICRDSDERVVKVGSLDEPWLGKACAEHPKRPTDRWMRFEYRHSEFWFPLIVNWVPEEGRILVDYNLSSELWRQETNAETEYPPYGGWVRVDDMVPDAFWCWPEGIFENAYQAEDVRKDDWGIFLIGKWHDRCWKSNLFARECSYENYWKVHESHTSVDAETSIAGYSILTTHMNKHLRIHHSLSNFIKLNYPENENKHKLRQDFKRVLDNNIHDKSNLGWIFVFESVTNIQKLLDEMGGRLCLPQFSADPEFYLDKHAGFHPYLLRLDGKAAITISSDYDQYIQKSEFSFFIEEKTKLKGYQFCCSSMLIDQQNYRNHWQGFFLDAVQAEFGLNTENKFEPQTGMRAVGGWGEDIDIAYLPKIIREIGNAMQAWDGIDYKLLDIDLPALLETDEFAAKSRFIGKKLNKFRHLLGFNHLFQMMGVLAGSGCMHRHRELGSNIGRFSRND